MNKIIVELHPEDRARLDRILAALEGSTSRPELPVEGAAHLEPVVNPTEPPLDAAGQKNGTEAAGGAFAKPVPAEPMSLGEFQKAVTTWLAGNPAKKPQARELVNRYAPSATEIPPEKRAEFLALLSAL